MDTECVTIADIGTFSRPQIEAMVYLTTIKRQCSERLAFCSWLKQDVASAVPAHLQKAVQTMADTASRLYPHEAINIDGKDYHFAMLYLLKPTNWANDALILALCGRLCAGKSTVRVVGVASARSASVRGSRQSLSDALKERAAALASAGEALLMPVNFANAHWCGIIVDVKLKRILYYDR
jgi:predicted nucleic acid-binding protein